MNTSLSRRPVGKEQHGGNEGHELIGARFDEDDGAGGADQPHQRALQCEHARRGRTEEGNPRLSPHTPSHTRNATQRSNAVPAHLVRVRAPAHQRQRRPQQNDSSSSGDQCPIRRDRTRRGPAFCHRVGLAALSADLRPAGDAGLDAMAAEIAVKRFGVVLCSLVRCTAWGRGPTSDMSPDRTFNSCGSSSMLVVRRNRPTRVTRGSWSRAWGRRVGRTAIHRAEFEDVMGSLLKPNRCWRKITGPGLSSLTASATSAITGAASSSTMEPTRVEQPFHHQIPVGDRCLRTCRGSEPCRDRNRARDESAACWCGGQLDIDRQHPKFLEHFDDSGLRRNRQREQHEIEAGAAGKSTMSSTFPSFGAPAQVSSARLSLRSSNTPRISMSESAWVLSASTSFSPL